MKGLPASPPQTDIVKLSRVCMLLSLWRQLQCCDVTRSRDNWHAIFSAEAAQSWTDVPRDTKTTMTACGAITGVLAVKRRRRHVDSSYTPFTRSSKRRAISTCILNTFAGSLLDRVNGVLVSGVARKIFTSRQRRNVDVTETRMPRKRHWWCARRCSTFQPVGTVSENVIN